MKAGDLLRSVADLVDAPRAAQHGDMRICHKNIATFWNIFLAMRRDPLAPLEPADVATMMALLKIARTQTGADNPDDLFDAAGYIAIAAELNDAE